MNKEELSVRLESKMYCLTWSCIKLIELFQVDYIQPKASHTTRNSAHYKDTGISGISILNERLLRSYLKSYSTELTQ